MGANESIPSEMKLFECANKDYPQFVTLYRKLVSSREISIDRAKRHQLLDLISRRSSFETTLAASNSTPDALIEAGSPETLALLNDYLSKDAPRLVVDGVAKASWIELCKAMQLYYIRDKLIEDPMCGCSGMGFLVNFVLLLCDNDVQRAFPTAIALVERCGGPFYLFRDPTTMMGAVGKLLGIDQSMVSMTLRLCKGDFAAFDDSLRFFEYYAAFPRVGPVVLACALVESCEMNGDFEADIMAISERSKTVKMDQLIPLACKYYQKHQSSIQSIFESN